MILNDSPSLTVPYLLSVAVHLLFFGYIVFNPGSKPETPFRPDQVINVSMVAMKESAGPLPGPQKSGAEKKAAPKPKPPKEEVKAAVKEPEAKDAVPLPAETEPPPKEAVSIAPEKLKVKTSLKKQTFKPKEVKQPVPKIKKEEAPQRESVSDALKKLQEKVSEDEKSGRYAVSEESSSQGGDQGAGGGAAGRRRAELIDLYRQEVALLVQKNWAFNEQLAGADDNLMVSLVFKVMPNGEIRDIFFLDRSGNQYLDESAIKAVQKTIPPPHPKGLVESFVDLALRFSPQGVK